MTRSRWLVISALAVGGCSLDSLVKNNTLPRDVTDPAITQSPDGAIAVYHGVLTKFRSAFGGEESAHDVSSVVAATGMFTDELLSSGASADGLTVDQRLLPETDDYFTQRTYGQLHEVRAQVSQAIGLLTKYVPDQPALVSHAYALAGYTELFFAEFFCSGVPLSTVDFEGDYTYRPGLSTEELLMHAQALFDTALTLASDSARFISLASMGRGRALLGLGDYAGAAAAVAAILDDYRYQISYTAEIGADAQSFADTGTNGRWALTVADREGVNGLDYRTSGDPRILVTPRKTYKVGTNTYTIFHPNKYAPDGSGSIVLASGVEARLIQAEAALHGGGGTWLNTLNALRTDGTSNPPDTLWDTLGVTGCGPSSSCGSSPASNAITKGQPANYPPAGYAAASADTTYPAPVGIKSYCQSYSWYKPCSQGDSMVVYIYVKPRFWHAGSGGVAGLTPLADPGTDEARVDLLFRERAFWLFLTGHRQGDLRRLIRQYGRPQEQLYPIGPYSGSTMGDFYGTDVTAPIPTSERILNPYLTGCASRDA